MQLYTADDKTKGLSLCSTFNIEYHEVMDM